MREAGYDVERHDDHFGPTTPDEVWLPAVAARGWLALSHNKHIKRVKEQRDAAMRAGLALFFLIGKRHDDLLHNLIATAPAIIAFRERHEPPFIASIHRPPAGLAVGSGPGRVQMSLTVEQWRASLSD